MRPCWSSLTTTSTSRPCWPRCGRDRGRGRSMSPTRSIVIVGAGPAGVGAALAARQQDAAADILLITDEACEPYEKPPLSKAALTGKAQPQDAPIAGPGGGGGHKARP